MPGWPGGAAAVSRSDAAHVARLPSVRRPFPSRAPVRRGVVWPPFVVLGMPSVDAPFEATSGITSSGLSVARAAASTGGVTPRGDSLASDGPAARVSVMSVRVVAAVSVVLYVRLWRKGPRGAVENGHVGPLLGRMAGGTAL